MNLINGVKYLDSKNKVVQIFNRFNFIDRGYDILLKYFSAKESANIVASIIDGYRDNNYFGITIGYVTGDNIEPCSNWDFSCYDNNGKSIYGDRYLVKPYIE